MIDIDRLKVETEKAALGLPFLSEEGEKAGA
jgi:hypothetical protein